MRILATTTVAAALLTVCATAVDAPAQAASRTAFSPTSTLAHGPLCGGIIEATAATKSREPGTVTVVLRADLQPLILLPAKRWICSVATTVHWRNLRTGAAGARTVTLSATPMPRLAVCTNIHRGLVCGTSAEFRIRTGRGPIEARVSTDSPHLPGAARYSRSAETPADRLARSPIRRVFAKEESCSLSPKQ